MKLWICFLIVFCTVSGLDGQSFQVIKVAGLITNCTSGDTLRMEDKIKATDSLCFVNTKEKYAVAALIDLKTKGRFLIKAGKTEAGVQPELVKNVLKRSDTRTGSRRGKINTILDLQTFFGNAEFLIMGGQLRLELNPESLPMDQKNFFYASYQYRGEKINKKLSYEGNELLLSAEELYKVDDEPIDALATTNFQLYYFPTATKKPVLITGFSPLFLSDELAGKELDVIYHTMVGTAPQLIQEELTAYLVEIYGKADAENVGAWLKAYLKGKE
jgi:hypothetical protein